MNNKLCTVPDAVAAIASGGFVIVVDAEERENEGDLIIAAEHASQAKLAFMIRHTSGIICAPCEPDRLTRLELPPMVERNQEPHRCVFTVSADYLPGMTTGVSALERARTLNALADPDSQAADFVRPGHIFPLKYRPGGVLVRSGHTEAALDLCRLANRAPVAALCELVNDDGTMQRLPNLLAFADAHQIPIISIEALIQFRACHDVLVKQTAATPIVLHGESLMVHVYRTVFDDREITALVKGEIDGAQPTLVRVVKGLQSRDFLGSAVTPGNVIFRSLELLLKAPQAVFIYLSAASADDEETSGAVWREVGLGSWVLNALGVRRIHLLASRELSFPGIASFGLTIETLIKEV
jgi:3,4-dihydroxy 2-butanone 4-phosphate synthase / GTP cyclohydrolase II